jgi:glycosyltransferase involved in cell wall biosynthesis
MTIPISINYILQGQLRYFNKQGFDVYSVSADGPEVESIREREKVKHTIIPFTRRITPVTDLYCLIKLIRFFNQVKPHIVHTQTPKAGLIGMIAAWLCRIPVRIHTVGGMPMMEASGLTKTILYWSEKITYACAHQVWPNSKALRDFMIKSLHVTESKLKVIGHGSSNGIDTEKFKRSPELISEANLLREKHFITSADTVFCFVGRLVRDKGVQELVEAFAKLQQKYSTIRLFLLGHFEDSVNPISDHHKQLMANNKRIVTTGFSTNVRLYMAASDIFVFPSYREGFPNVVLQACAMELPSIVTDINGSNEIISNLHNGLIIQTKNASELYSAMELLLTDKNLRQTLASNARPTVIDLFDQHYFWNTLKQEYLTLLAQRVS